MPVSRLTIRALRDLGYTTDLSQADPFAVVLPTASPTPFRGLIGRRRLRKSDQEEEKDDDDEEDTRGHGNPHHDHKEPLVGDVVYIPVTRMKGRLKPGRTRDVGDMEDDESDDDDSPEKD